MRYRAQPATSFDVAFLAMVLDETGGAFVDRTGMKPANRLLKSCAFSAQIWTARDLGDSTPAALWGVVPQPDDLDVGCLWMLAADPFDEAPDELETLSRLVLA